MYNLYMIFHMQTTLKTSIVSAAIIWFARQGTIGNMIAIKGKMACLSTDFERFRLISLSV